MFNAIAPPISWSFIGGCAALVSRILLFNFVYDCDLFVVSFYEFIQFLIVRRDNAFNEAIEIFAETTNHTTITTIKVVATTIKEGSHRTTRNSTKKKDVRKAKENLSTRRAKVKAKVGEKVRTIKANETPLTSKNLK